MKKRAAILLLLLAIIALAQKSLGAELDTRYIWSANIPNNGHIAGAVFANPIEKIDLNNDGQPEQLYITTRIGTSQNGNTLEIKSALGMRQLLRISFSSVGGVAIGNFIPGQHEKQVAVWDFWQDTGESHTSKHYFRITVYKWNPAGNQEMIVTWHYQTKEKYPFVARNPKPLREFLNSRVKAVYLGDIERLKAHDVSAADLEEIKAASPKWGNRKVKITHAKQIGSWVIGNYGDELLVWRKTNGVWRVIKSGSDLPDENDHEIAQQIGAPGIWPKLHRAYLAGLR